MSQTMRARPSSMLGLTDPWVAFCLDRAVWTFAMEIEREQNIAENRLPQSAKDAAHTRARQRVLDKYLGIEEAEPSRFRSISG